MFRKIIYLVTVLLFSSGLLYAQNKVEKKEFTHAPVYNSKVMFIKEIPLKGNNHEEAFLKLKDWGKEKFSSYKDPDIRYDNRNKEVIIRTQTDLKLHGNEKISKGTMSFSLNSFILNGNCILEIKNITYRTDHPDLPKTAKASEIITDRMLKKQDDLSQLRSDVLQETLGFVNQTAKELESIINRPDQE